MDMCARSLILFVIMTISCVCVCRTICAHQSTSHQCGDFAVNNWLLTNSVVVFFFVALAMVWCQCYVANRMWCYAHAAVETTPCYGVHVIATPWHVTRPIENSKRFDSRGVCAIEKSIELLQQTDGTRRCSRSSFRLYFIASHRSARACD